MWGVYTIFRHTHICHISSVNHHICRISWVKSQHLKKYEFVSWDYYSHYTESHLKKSCSKPPPTKYSKHLWQCYFNNKKYNTGYKMVKISKIWKVHHGEAPHPTKSGHVKGITRVVGQKNSRGREVLSNCRCRVT
jgi:hypothetical protein